jgi:hypothetical protein
MDKIAVEKLLDKVVNDAEFRRSLERDPVDTLAKIGISLDPTFVPQGGVHLPPPDKILKLWLERLLRHEEIGLSDHFLYLFRR